MGSDKLEQSEETVSAVGTRNFDSLSPMSERALVKQLDRRLLPVLIVLYLMAFLDRVNIGNALTLGLPADLKLKGNQANIALTIFYVPYIVFEIPSNLLLRRFKPHRWLALSMFAFGLVELSQGFVTNYSGLIAVRFFLGLTEAGVFPGCFYLMSMWYKQEESQRRFTLFFSSVTLAGAFGSLLASGIENMNGVRGKAGWRWIFILEGLLTMVLALVSYFLIPDFPEDVKWLSAHAKVFMRERLLVDDDEEITSSKTSRFIGFFSDLKSYLGALMYFGGVTVGYSLTYFLPTIVKGYHYSTISTQLHSTPPFAAAFGLGIITAFLSDRVRHRAAFVMIPLLMAIAGAAILFKVHNNVRVEYAAVILVIMGTFSAIPVAMCWYFMNLRSEFHRSLGSAWTVSFGNVGGIIATWSFMAKDSPLYHTGYSVVMAGLCIMFAASVAYVLVCVWENRRAGTVARTRMLL